VYHYKTAVLEYQEEGGATSKGYWNNPSIEVWLEGTESLLKEYSHILKSQVCHEEEEVWKSLYYSDLKNQHELELVEDL
jgi:hypothetical protein